MNPEVADVLAGRRGWAVACSDVADFLRSLPDNCVHSCVTSPPYYALRDYGVDGQLGLESLPDCSGWATKDPCDGDWLVLRDDLNPEDVLKVYDELRRSGLI